MSEKKLKLKQGTQISIWILSLGLAGCQSLSDVQKEGASAPFSALRAFPGADGAGQFSLGGVAAAFSQSRTFRIQAQAHCVKLLRPQVLELLYLLSLAPFN